jgi:hypothetical protein
LREWFRGPAGFPLIGTDSQTWGNLFENEVNKATGQRSDLQDLVAPAMEPRNNSIIEIIVRLILPTYHRFFGSRKQASNGGTIVSYSDTTIIRISTAITTLIACLLPIASATALYAIKNMAIRLGVVAALTMTATLAIMLLTAATTREIIFISVA